MSDVRSLVALGEMKFAKPGTYTVVATATESVRDELTVKATC